MKLSRTFAAGIAMLIAAACTSDSIDNPGQAVPGDILYATVESQTDAGEAGSKVLVNNGSLSWESGDRISVFPRTTACVPYDFQGIGSDGRGTFSSSATPGSGSALSATYAIYPHASSNSMSAEGKLSYTFPSQQQYRASSFGQGAGAMVAATNDNTLQFKNMGGCFVIRLYGAGVKVSSIELRGNNSEPIAGKANVSMSVGDAPSVSVASGGNPKVTLSCPEPVSIGSGASSSTEFWFVLPPTVFKKGITVTVNTAGGGSVESTTSNKLEIKRSRITYAKPLEISVLAHVTYTESTASFPNPERGFYTECSFDDESDSALSSSFLSSQRASGESLVMLLFYLNDFVNSDISAKYLSLIEKNFKVLRSSGVKCILRFAYSGSENDHPYDASEARVLSHISQLTNLLQTYSDVIMVMQAGFVGVWGEWYYTENFIQGPTSTSDYLPRKHVADALLQALPEDRQIELRTPTFKMKMYGKSLSDTITVKTAFNGSTNSRLGGHIDCFLADSNDTGTYQDDTERKYWKAETRYTIMGGETCGLSDYCHCSSTSGKPGAIKSMEEYHFTYLNSGYHPSVLKRWKSENCYDEIERRLGYRLVLEEGWFSESPVAGGECKVTLKLHNAGFASIMNERPAELVLTDAYDNVLQTWPLGSDPRSWRPGGSITIETSVTLPKNLSGTCRLYLNLPDASDKLRDKPAFSVRLANENVWDAGTGYNLLRTFKF